MKLQRNENMDYMEIDDENMAVFDPASGDTHFFDGVGIDILNILVQPTDIDELVNKLIKMYKADYQEIFADTKEFIEKLKVKRVVVEIADS
ncbi:MAG: HPr-rel-A system PqqD family peptide chaperone [Saccharofermentanales bacterium]